MKTILITGASSGIGRALAVQAARAGYSVYAVGRNVRALAALAGQIGEEGGTIVTDVCDISDPANAPGLIGRAVGAFGHVDILVNNAGAAAVGPISMQSDEQLRAQFGTHVIGPLALTREALPTLRASRGHVFMLGSGVARVPVPGMGAYPPSKAALRSATSILRREIAALDVAVTYVDPGAVDTGFMTRAGMPGAPREVLVSPEMVARKILMAIGTRPRAVNVAPLQTAAVALGEVFPVLAEAVLQHNPNMIGAGPSVAALDLQRDNNGRGEKIALPSARPIPISSDPVAVPIAEPPIVPPPTAFAAELLARPEEKPVPDFMASVIDAMKHPTIDAVPEAPAIDAMPKPPVADAMPNAPLAEATPSWPVADEIATPPVVDAMPQPPNNGAIPEAPANGATPQTPFNGATPQTPFNGATPQSPVNGATSQSPFNGATSQAPFNGATPDREIAPRESVPQSPLEALLVTVEGEPYEQPPARWQYEPPEEPVVDPEDLSADAATASFVAPADAASAPVPPTPAPPTIAAFAPAAAMQSSDVSHHADTSALLDDDLYDQDEPAAHDDMEPLTAHSSFDAALEPLQRRMERANMRLDFVRSLMVLDSVIDVGDAAMRWAGMPNKHERALTSEVFFALAEWGFLAPRADGRYRVLYEADADPAV